MIATPRPTLPTRPGPDQQEWLTRADVLAWLYNRGIVVTERQLKRWATYRWISEPTYGVAPGAKARHKTALYRADQCNDILLCCLVLRHVSFTALRKAGVLTMTIDYLDGTKTTLTIAPLKEIPA